MAWLFNRKRNESNVLGYFADQQGIINRYMREGPNWKHHLQKSSEYIKSFCEQVNIHSSIAVLGSGWLFDVPLEYLSERFQQVYLVDINHPAQVKHKVSYFPNINLIQKDLTGYVKFVSRIIEEFRKTGRLSSLVNQAASDPLNELTPGCLVSLNLLTQLDDILCKYLSRQKIYSEDQVFEFGKKVQLEHLHLLTRFPSCLISDTEEMFIDARKMVADKKQTLKVEWPQGLHPESWDWKFDNHYTYHEQYNVILKVKAIMLI